MCTELQKKDLRPTYSWQILRVGVNLEGFWNYDQMALQVEDVYDVLAIKYPAYDFLMMLDQSSDHGRMRQESLNEENMSVKWGGQQDKLRNTIIQELGPNWSILAIEAR